MTVNYLLILVVLLLFAGLGVDAGMLEWRYLQMSAAAHAAATSGALGLQRYGTGGVSPGALNAASLNGFTNGVNGVNVSVKNPPTSGTYANVTSAVRVTITQSVPTSFMSLAAFPAVTMKARYDEPGITPVSLTSSFNIYAIYRDTSSVVDGGFDTSNYGYSANALDPVRTANNLGALLSWRGNIFSLGLPDGKNGAANVTIPLTSGNFSQLLMVAATSYGPNTASFVVNYADGSTATTTLTMSDWVNISGFANEVVLQRTGYLVHGTGGPDPIATAIYGYAINLNNLKTVSSLTLPNSRNVVVFAIDLMP